jgi:hypothetical protein
VPAVVHLVPRPVLTEPSSLARDLANTPWSEQPITVRVIELFEPRAGASTVDLTLAERDVPEIAAVLHDATELHLHGIHPRVALRCLPDVKHAVLAGISVVVHGPVTAARERSGESAAPWPGPVHADAEAATSVESTGPGAPSHLFIDVHAPDLLPRACGPLPLVLDDCGRLAVICLAETLSDRVREHLRLEFEALSRPEVRLEVYDECDVPIRDRAARRRAASAVVAGQDADAPYSRTFVESLVQGVPLVVLGDTPADAPRGVVFTGTRNDVDRAVACVRSWVASWAVGEAPDVDVGARNRWLALRRPALG